MARWATTTILGTEDFSGCRVELVDAEQFTDSLAMSADWANDGSVHVQSINRGVHGIRFGVKMVSAQKTKLQSVFSQFATAGATQSGIRIQVVESLFNIDVVGIRDATVKSFDYQQQSEDYYEGVVLRFISIRAYP